MASKINGTWKLIYADFVGEYCDAIGCKKEYRDLALKLLMPSNNITQDIKITDTSVSIITTMPGKTNNVEAQLGSPFETQFLDERKIQCVFTTEGDKLCEEQTGAFHSHNVRFVDGDTLYLTMTANGVTTTRKYERV